MRKSKKYDDFESGSDLLVLTSPTLDDLRRAKDLLNSAPVKPPTVAFMSKGCFKQCGGDLRYVRGQKTSSVIIVQRIKGKTTARWA
jgi:hypothetical protein